MASWVMLFFCCFLFVTCCCTLTSAHDALLIDCCLAVKNKTIERRFVADYRQQIRGQGCTLDATVLVTRRGVKLCVPGDEPWVHVVMKHADRLKKYCKKKNHKGKRCTGVKPE